MKITCRFGEFDVFGYMHPHTGHIESAVTAESLVQSLGLSMRKLPKEPGLIYVRTGEGELGVALTSLNTFLFNVKTSPDVRNNLLLELTQRTSQDIGFLTHAHLQLQDALSALGAYYIETDQDGEYPIDEVEDCLGQIFCEFLLAGAYDPLNMTRDRQPMTEPEAWMLSMLETSAAGLIREFIREGNHPDIVLMYLQVGLKEKLLGITDGIQRLAVHFITPEDLQTIRDIQELNR